MKSLNQILISAVAAVGLAAACGDSTPIVDQIQLVCNTQNPTPYSDQVKVPESVDYEIITWNRAYFQAVTLGGEDILPLYLRFESDCKDKPGIKAIRVLSYEELQKLGIKTRQDADTYLKNRCSQVKGYIGSNIML